MHVGRYADAGEPMTGERMKQLSKKNKGFTLIELMIASVIMLTILTVAGSMMFGGFKSFFSSTSMVNGQEAVRAVVSRVSQDLRKADTAAQVTVSATSITITPAAGGASTYTYNSGAHTVSYNGTAIATGINGFTAANNSGAVSVTVSSGDGGGYSLTTSITLR